VACHVRGPLRVPETRPPPDLGILQRYAPGVLVFGAEYCGPCKVFCKRLKGLDLEEGKHWHYVDAEDFSPNGGAELLDVVGIPFAPLPLLAVLNSKGERSLLRAGQELLQAGNTELRSWFDGSYSTPEKTRPAVCYWHPVRDART
ncbi:unnamed protein product, partial [Cladocopium goreaui]